MPYKDPAIQKAHEGIRLRRLQQRIRLLRQVFVRMPAERLARVRAVLSHAELMAFDDAVVPGGSRE